MTDADRAADIRQLVEHLRLMLATGTVDQPATRRAANELSDLADAIAGGGGLARGYAAVPLLDAAVLPAPVPPPCLNTPHGGGTDLQTVSA